LTSKFLKLRRGDLIIIRDGRKKRSLSFFGHCRVVGETFNHDRYSPFRDFLWPDEEAKQKVIYPLRVAVDFVDVLKLRLENITRHTLDDLGFEGTKWSRIEGKQTWAKKSSGDFIEDGLLDSFDVVTLVGTLDKTYHISISGVDIVPENFKNLQTITALLRKCGVQS